MGSAQAPADSPTTSDELTAALNAALKEGDLYRIMGIMGQIARAYRMRLLTRVTGLGEKSLYKSMRAGASPEFNAVLRVLSSLNFASKYTWKRVTDSQLIRPMLEVGSYRRMCSETL